MGYGDEIMAVGYARVAIERALHHMHAYICDWKGNPRWHAMFLNIPWLLHPSVLDSRAIKVKNGINCRPYLDNKKCGPDNFGYNYDYSVNDFKGAIWFNDSETGAWSNSAMKDAIVIEPNVKGLKNKDWGFEKYQEIIDSFPDVNWVQFKYINQPMNLPDARMLSGVTQIVTPTFRHAALLLKNSSGFLGPEGGLHHAAGVLDIPAVVIFGGFVDPKLTGYTLHTNLYESMGREEACGFRSICPHCVASMKAISVDMVKDSVGGLLSHVF